MKSITPLRARFGNTCSAKKEGRWSVSTNVVSSTMHSEAHMSHSLMTAADMLFFASIVFVGVVKTIDRPPTTRISVGALELTNDFTNFDVSVD